MLRLAVSTLSRRCAAVPSSTRYTGMAAKFLSTSAGSNGGEGPPFGSGQRQAAPSGGGSSGIAVPDDDLEEDLEEDIAEGGGRGPVAQAACVDAFGGTREPLDFAGAEEEAALARARLVPADLADEEIEGIVERIAFRKAGYDPEADEAEASPDDVPYPKEEFERLQRKAAREDQWRTYLGGLQFGDRWPMPDSPRDRAERRMVLRCGGQKQGRAGEAGHCRIFDVRDLHFQNLPLLRRFLKEGAMLRGRRETGLCAKCQRKVAHTVRRARQIGVLPNVDSFGIFDAGPPPKPRTFHEPVAAVSKFGSL